MLFRFIILFVLLVLILLIGLFVYKSYCSQNMEPNVGVEGGQLKACDEKPNCVSSFSPKNDEEHHYSAFETEPIAPLWDHLESIIKDLGLKIVTIDDQYIHATDTTKIMRYVDDLEFLLSETDNKIYVRSASRVGYSDLGANRKRMDKIKERLFEQ